MTKNNLTNNTAALCLNGNLFLLYFIKIICGSLLCILQNCPEIIRIAIFNENMGKRFCLIVRSKRKKILNEFR